MQRSTVAQAVGGALPLRDVVGDHARRLHRGLAELGVAGDLALDALALGMQQVAQALELRDQLLDFRKRSAGDALDQRVDVVDGGFRLRIDRRGVRARDRRPAQIGDIVADEFTDAFLDLRNGGKVTVGLGGFDLFGANGSVHRLFPMFALARARTSPARRRLSASLSGRPNLAANGPICGDAGSFLGSAGGQGAYQLRLKPAPKLLLVAPVAVSPIEPEMVTPSNSFCSAPILPSHLSSFEDSVRPAVKLVPVSVIASLADWSLS